MSSKLIDGEAMIERNGLNNFGMMLNSDIVAMIENEPSFQMVAAAANIGRMVPIMSEWIPFKRDIENPYYLVGKIPDDEQDIIITVKYKGDLSTQVDIFSNDGNECSLDSGYSLVDEAVAWMPMPEPYREPKNG